MTLDESCYRCGSKNLEAGAVQSAGTVSFRPASTPFFKLAPGNVSVAARVCMECGNIELVADVKKVGALIRSNRETSRTA